MSVTTTTTQQRFHPSQMHLLIRSPSQPVPSATRTAGQAVDPIYAQLCAMVEEGLVSKEELEQVFDYYKKLPSEDGLGKAFLLCNVISKVVQNKIEVERDEASLSLLSECQDQLKKLLQKLLVEEVDANDFLALYDDCYLRMLIDQITVKIINECAQERFQLQAASEQEVKLAVITICDKLSARIAAFAQFREEMGVALYQRVADLAKRVEEARQVTLTHQGALKALGERLKNHQMLVDQLTQDLRPLMEKLKRK